MVESSSGAMSTSGSRASARATTSDHGTAPSTASPLATTTRRMPHSARIDAGRRSSRSPSTMATVAPESPNAYLISSVIHQAFRLTTMAPMLSTAQNASANSG